MENKKYWIWLSLIKRLGSRKKQKLLELYKTPERIYNLNKKELMSVSGIGEEIAENILENKIRANLEKYIDYMQRNNVDILPINVESYPQILKEIYDPPISLYIKGNKEILNNKAIGIVRM